MSETSNVASQTALQPDGTVEVTIRHQGDEHKIIGSPDGVIRQVLLYFSKIYPSLELTSKIILSPDNEQFLQNSAGVLATTPEGLAILKDTEQLKDKELVMLQLAGARLLHLVARKESDTASLDELTRSTGRSTGTVAGRLSELCNEQLAERVGKGSYRLTTMGARTVVKTLLPKLAGSPDR